jgi:hypothetical protein
MGKYRKKPVVIEAVHYRGGGYCDGRGLPDWLWVALEDETCRSTNGTDPFIIKTLEGEMVCAPGDWIIKGVKGELYPCKPDIFEATYEKVEE